MRATWIAFAIVAIFTAAASAQISIPLLEVDDGDYFYDTDATDGVCQGTTDDYTQGEATRHWHIGVPYAGPGLLGDGVPLVGDEVLAGTGCLGGPKSWTITVPEGRVGTGVGSIRYTWDQDVPGGGFNDVHLHVMDAAGARVYSTVDDPGVGTNPVNPVTGPLFLEHEFSFSLPPGTYTIAEDVFSGEHTAWLTKLRVDALVQPIPEG